jgi:hypothetical protein
MQLEELQSAWQKTNDRLDALQVHSFALQSTSSHRRFQAETIWQLAFAIPTVFWSGGFLFDNLERVLKNPMLAIPALLVYALSIASIGGSIWVLVQGSNLDYALPIAETQKRLARIRAFNVRSTRAVMLLGIPLWVVFPILLIQTILGYSWLATFDLTYLIVNILFGIAVSLGTVVAAKRAPQSSKLFRTIDDAFAGNAVAAAEADLALFAELSEEVKEVKR